MLRPHARYFYSRETLPFATVGQERSFKASGKAS
jgi:hypothetical protein